MVHGAIFGSNKATLYFQVDKRCIKTVDYKKQLIPNLVKKFKLINVIIHLHIQLKQLKQSLRHDASIEEKSKFQNISRIRFFLNPDSFSLVLFVLDTQCTCETLPYCKIQYKTWIIE
ncbi:Hypothetical_protein [Hexamita inflata]|uniref:Hypothetical_protein n=1 Tax=Hexamita inflata TaxID=28002 RepID=A0AA86RBS7_9EUKA|nr:Hypothetical protein HINF_LOCUS62180 [Hexamita inflata]